MTDVYQGFEDAADVLKEFEAPADALEGAKVLLAIYSRGGYEGSAFVVFRKGGKLYEAHGSHCSCYGLEGMWDPEETSVEALAKRGYYDHDVNAALEALVSRLQKKRRGQQSAT